MYIFLDIEKLHFVLKHDNTCRSGGGPGLPDWYFFMLDNLQDYVFKHQNTA